MSSRSSKSTCRPGAVAQADLCQSSHEGLGPDAASGLQAASTDAETDKQADVTVPSQSPHEDPDASLRLATSGCENNPVPVAQRIPLGGPAHRA